MCLAGGASAATVVTGADRSTEGLEITPDSDPLMNNVELWVQYWFFYYYSDLDFAGFGSHKGDWEMVQYGLTESGAPDVATYAQHGDADAERCSWSMVEKETVSDPVTGTRQAPGAYVAAGSQASYFIHGVHERDDVPDDAANGDGEAREPVLETISDAAPAWVRGPGRWGSSSDVAGTSPPSPGNQGKRWSAPGAFNADAGFCANLDGTPR
jgi:hypothetical protein